LTPFSEATTVALTSLGTAGEASGPIFREADPIVRKSAALAKTGVVPTTELAKLLTSIKKTGGWDGLVELIYNSAASLNGFDNYGHFGRTLITLSNCLEYEPVAVGQSACVANFNGPNAGEAQSSNAAALFRMLERKMSERTGGTSAGARPATGVAQAGSAESKGEGEAGLGEASKSDAGTQPLLDYLLGP
jgi:hypothetical protein